MTGAAKIKARIGSAAAGLKAVGQARGTDSQSAVIVVKRNGRNNSLKITYGNQKVGGSVDCDLVVLGVEPKPAFRLVLERQNGTDLLRLEALRDGIKIGNEQIASGSIVKLAANQNISFDGVDCHVEGVRGGLSAGKKSRKLIAATLFALAALMLYIGVLQDNTKPDIAQAASAPVKLDDDLDANELSREIKEGLRLAGLNVNVETSANGLQILVGRESQNLSPAQKERLANILSAFSHRSKILIKDISGVSSGLAPMIAAVSLEPERFIVGKEGQHYKEGDILADGWRVETIRQGIVSLARGGDEDHIAYGLGPKKALSTLNLRLASLGDGAGS